eukprot:CAMPEP_0119385252 /NCGR_PEP_ID=MMETSP1334-20130426/90191_1 /TAXON_ID=127549 /ORGANISM="Calcidiscus leptoporus, Strain RCC1130" /LENGTH=169 /DNA_ID=CAMNT_0007406493 /DNA_START=348 /DNA_END=853 /DNA_ORIENTATION=-
MHINEVPHAHPHHQPRENRPQRASAVTETEGGSVEVDSPVAAARRSAHLGPLKPTLCRCRGTLRQSIRHSQRTHVLVSAADVRLVVERARAEEADPSNGKHAQLGPPRRRHEVLLEQIPHPHPQQDARRDGGQRLRHRKRVEVDGELSRARSLLRDVNTKQERAHKTDA